MGYIPYLCKELKNKDYMESLNLKRAREHSYYRENPFKPEGIEAKTIMVGGDEAEVTNIHTGEISTLISTKESVTTIKDTKPFVKTYNEFWDILPLLSKQSISILAYIHHLLVPNKDIIHMSVDGALEYTGYKTAATYYKGLVDLLNYQLIARVSGSDTSFFINVNLMFNGNRAKL